MATHDAQQVRECMGKFSALEKKMETITNGSGTGTLDRLNEEFFNHDGRPGLKSQFMLYLREQKILREQNDLKLKSDADAVRDTLLEHDRRSNKRTNIILAVCAILALFHGVPGIINTIEKLVHDIKINEFHIPKIPPLTKGQLYQAHAQTQDAQFHQLQSVR